LNGNVRFEIVKEKQKPEETIVAFSKYKSSLLKNKTPSRKIPKGVKQV